MLRSAAYLSGAIVLTALVHAYLHRRLIRDTELPLAWRRRARAATILAAALLPAGMAGLLTMREAPRALATPLMWCAFGWMGLLLFLLPLVLAGEAVRAWWLRGEASRALDQPDDSGRRRTLARAIALFSGASTLGLGGAAAVVAQLPPRVQRFAISLRGLGRAMNGYRIVQISDVHASATIGRALIESIVAAANSLEPDLVAVTGDLVDGSVKELREIVAPLASLRARDGVYFVTGNHEYLSGATEWLEFLGSLGVRVLRNERVAIGADGGFDLVGIDDPSGSDWIDGHGPNLAGAVAGRDPSRASVLLAHRPDDVHAAASHGIDLQLSGHTHGGQMPIGWAIERLVQPYVFGLYTVRDTTLYVTSGAGYWGPPMRLATRAEIVAIDLQAPGT